MSVIISKKIVVPVVFPGNVLTIQYESELPRSYFDVYVNGVLMDPVENMVTYYNDYELTINVSLLQTLGRRYSATMGGTLFGFFQNSNDSAEFSPYKPTGDQSFVLKVY